MRSVFIVSLLAATAPVAVACSSSESTPGAGPSMTAPSGLTATPMGTGVHLVWKDNSSGEDEFEIERKPSGPDKPFLKVASVAFDVVQFHDTGVNAGVSYAYRVRAISETSRSVYSNEITVVAPTSATGEDAGTATDSGPGPSWDGGAVSFTQHIIPLFEKSCGANNTVCHARDGYGANSTKDCRGWLALENAPLGAQFYGGSQVGQSTGCPDLSLYARLTQLDAWQEPEGQLRRYVKPNDPQASYLYNKIAGGPYGEDRPGVSSVAMPLNATLPATDIAMVKKWIESGAPEN